MLSMLPKPEGSVQLVGVFAPRSVVGEMLELMLAFELPQRDELVRASDYLVERFGVGSFVELRTEHQNGNIFRLYVPGVCETLFYWTAAKAFPVKAYLDWHS